MKGSLSSLLAAPLAAVVLVSFAWVPVAEAAGRDGGGGGRAGGGGGGARAGAAAGGARAGAGGGGRQAAQANNSRADARTNDVRSSSANSVNNTNRNTNVNANRNTNVNANRNTNVVVAGGNNNNCCGGWDNDYHPVAGAVAVGAAVAVTSAAIGSMVRSVPANCVPVNYSGMVYQQCGSTWYQPQGSQYVVVNAPY